MKSELVISPKGDTINILEGEALPLFNPERLSITGQIDSVRKYLDARRGTDQAPGQLQHVNKDLAVITVDEDAMSIRLDVDPNEHFGTVVVGALKHNPELQQFQIDKKHKFSKQDLLDLFRYNRRFFNDIVEHSNIIAALQRLEISTNSKISQEADTRGNRTNNFQKTVDSAAIPPNFVLNIPIYKGQPAKKFVVDICLDTTENNVRFWLESVELIEIADVDKKKIISDQLADYTDYCIIWK